MAEALEESEMRWVLEAYRLEKLMMSLESLKAGTAELTGNEHDCQ